MTNNKPKKPTPKKEGNKIWTKELGQLLQKASRDYHRREEEIYRANMQNPSS